MQEQEGQDVQPESQAPIPEIEPEVVTPSPEPEPEEAPVPKRRLRRFLSWAVALIIILAAGVILTWTLRVQPQVAQIEALQSEVQTLQSEVDAQLSELEQLRPMVAEVDLLKEQVAMAEAHLDLLTVLVDVTTAQLALAQEDDIAAKAALTGTTEHLQMLESTLEGANASEVADMVERLQLVLEEVETDTFAARRDLEILANNLLALERVLFGE